MDDVVKVGFGKSKVKINDEDLPIREFQKTLTDLYTRCAIFEESGDIKFVLISFEMTSLIQRDIDRFKRLIKSNLGVKENRIWITVTHTFSAPHLKHELKSELDRIVYENFISKLEASVISACYQAKSDLDFVKVSLKSINCSLNINRNVKTKSGWWLGINPKSYSNHDLNILVFEKRNGSRNFVFNLDVQPSVMDHISDDNDNRVITGDIFGIASQKIESKKNNVVIPLIGAAGDQRPLFKAENDNSFEYNQALLFEQSNFLVQLIEDATCDINSAVQIKKVQLFNLSLRLPSQIQQQDTFGIKPTKHYHFELSSKGVDITIECFKINDLVIIGTQPELNSSFANKCKEMVGSEKVIITTLVNGGAKYLPERKDFKNITYESMNTQIGPGADEVMLDGMEQLNKLIGRRL